MKITDVQPDLAQSSILKPSLVHIRTQVERTKNMHGLPFPVLPFFVSYLSSKVTSVQDTRHSHLTEDEIGVVNRDPVMSTIVHDDF